MKIIISFDVSVSGIDDEQAAKIFFQRLVLAENVIADEDGEFSIEVNGFEMLEQNDAVKAI